MTPVRFPDPAMVVLVGASGSGKSTWAHARFRSVEVVSSDALRAVVGSGPADLDASTEAFELLDQIVAARLRRSLTTVVDTLGLDPERRFGYLRAARDAGLPAVLVIMDTTAALCRERNRERDRPVPARVLTEQLRRTRAAVAVAEDEGWDEVVVITGPDPAPPVAPTPAAAVADPDDGSGPRVMLQVSRFPWGEDPLGWLRDLATTADQLGFAGLALMDHLIQIPQVDRAWEPIPEPWVTLGLLAGLDTRLRLGTLVSPVTFRAPGIIAKTVATLDALSGGRAFCGLGAGWWLREHQAYGLDFPPAHPHRRQLAGPGQARRMHGRRILRRDVPPAVRRAPALAGRRRRTERRPVGGGGTTANASSGTPSPPSRRAGLPGIRRPRRRGSRAMVNRPTRRPAAAEPVDDPGLFGPESVTWRIHRDPSMLVAGFRALLLQAVHPLVMAGFDDNTFFRTDPWGRLQRTSAWVGTVTYGTTAEAELAGTRLRRLHASLPPGIEPESGEAYRIDDPDLLLWVHNTEVESFLTTYRRSGGALRRGDADRYVAEMQESARLVGIPVEMAPATEADLADYYATVRPQLRVTAVARRNVLWSFAPPMPRWVKLATPARPAWASLITLAASMLPPWARRLYRLPGLPTTDLGASMTARMVRRSLLLLPEDLVGNPAYKAARERVSMSSAA